MPISIPSVTPMFFPAMTPASYAAFTACSVLFVSLTTANIIGTFWGYGKPFLGYLPFFWMSLKINELQRSTYGRVKIGKDLQK